MGYDSKALKFNESLLQALVCAASHGHASSRCYKQWSKMPHVKEAVGGAGKLMIRDFCNSVRQGAMVEPSWLSVYLLLCLYVYVGSSAGACVLSLAGKLLHRLDEHMCDEILKQLSLNPHVLDSIAGDEAGLDVFESLVGRCSVDCAMSVVENGLSALKRGRCTLASILMRSGILSANQAEMIFGKLLEETGTVGLSLDVLRVFRNCLDLLSVESKSRSLGLYRRLFKVLIDFDADTQSLLEGQVCLSFLVGALSEDPDVMRFVNGIFESNRVKSEPGALSILCSYLQNGLLDFSAWFKRIASGVSDPSVLVVCLTSLLRNKNYRKDAERSALSAAIVLGSCLPSLPQSDYACIVDFLSDFDLGTTRMFFEHCKRLGERTRTAMLELYTMLVRVSGQAIVAAVFSIVTEDLPQGSTLRGQTDLKLLGLFIDLLLESYSVDAERLVTGEGRHVERAIGFLELSIGLMSGRGSTDIKEPETLPLDRPLPLDRMGSLFVKVCERCSSPQLKSLILSVMSLHTHFAVTLVTLAWKELGMQMCACTTETLFHTLTIYKKCDLRTKLAIKDLSDVVESMTGEKVAVKFDL